MGRFRKIDVRIWNDERFRVLSDDAKLVFLLLLTHPHMTAIGAMRTTLPGLAAEIGWNEERLSKGFAEISEKGMARHDQIACVAWLPNFIKYNGPENPNVLKAWAAAVDALPESALTREAIEAVGTFSKGLPQSFREALPEPFRKGMAKQEPEPEPEPEQENPSGAVAAPVRTTSDDEEPEFAAAWALYPTREGSNPRKDALKAWRARRRAGVPGSTLVAGVERYAAYVAAKGWTGSSFVMQGARFFGASEPFREPWDVQVEADRPDARSSTWRRNEQQLVAKGRELGLAARPGEDGEAFARRIDEAIARRDRRAVPATREAAA